MYQANYHSMSPFLPERTNYRSSFLFVLSGLFFIIYPVVGILKDDLLFKFRPLSKGAHLHGTDAVIIGVGLILIGTSALLSGIRNILEERQREQNLYTRKGYPRLGKMLIWFRDLGVVVLFLFVLVRMVVGVFDWLT